MAQNVCWFGNCLIPWFNLVLILPRRTMHLLIRWKKEPCKVTTLCFVLTEEERERGFLKKRVCRRIIIICYLYLLVDYMSLPASPMTCGTINCCVYKHLFIQFGRTEIHLGILPTESNGIIRESTRSRVSRVAQPERA